MTDRGARARAERRALAVLLGLGLTAGAWLGACSDVDDGICEVTCQCNNGTQYRDAGFCDRETLVCVSGQAECEALCEDEGGLEALCSRVEGQPLAHSAPEIACPGEEPEGRDCDPELDGCAIGGPRSGGELLALLLPLSLWTGRRRRRR